MKKGVKKWGMLLTAGTMLLWLTSCGQNADIGINLVEDDDNNQID